MTFLKTREKISLKGFISRLTSEFGFIRGNLLVMILSMLILDFGYEIPQTYYPLYVKALGGSASIIGLIGFASSISHAIVQFPGGYFTDKYGRKRIIVIMTFVATFSWLIFAFATSWEIVMLAVVIQSLCRIYIPAMQALVMDSIPEERRGIGFSIQNFIIEISGTPSPLVAAFLYLNFGLVEGMRIGYIIVFGIAIIGATVRLRLKETITEPKSFDRKEFLSLYPKTFIESLKIWRLFPRYALYIFLIDITLAFSGSMIFPYFLLYATDILGISPVDWSFIATSLSIFMIAFVIPVGKIVDRGGSNLSLIIACMLLIIESLLFIRGNYLVVFLAMALGGFGGNLRGAAIPTKYSELVGQEKRGRIIGLSRLFRFIAVSFGSLLGGLLYERISPQTPFLLQLILVIPPIILILYLPRQSKEKLTSTEGDII